MTIEDFLKESKSRVEKSLAEFLSEKPVSPRLDEAMRYSLFAGGKRVRPALAYAACRAVGADEEMANPAACSLEMIHTYSLIHDDLPAMDNDDLRRGKPTNHKVFGDGHAILAGDGLLTEAFLCLADPSWKIKAEDRLDIVGIIAEGSGANGMVGGQALDLEFEGKTVKEEELEKIHRNKTGKLLRASVLAGGKSGGASKEVFENLDQYGRAIGLAFQVADDILDLTQSTEKLGKNSKSDLKHHKATYPSVLGMDEAKKRKGSLLEEALTAANTFGKNGDMLQALARFIVDRSF